MIHYYRAHAHFLSSIVRQQPIKKKKDIFNFFLNAKNSQNIFSSLCPRQFKKSL